jgi:hypothetical protein
MTRSLGSLGAVLLLLLSAGAAYARTLTVAANGVDSAQCGTTVPCRSLGQAIDLAVDGDTIVVGPGRYGDLNLNGTFGEPGEEAAPAGCRCMIQIAKRVAVVSRDGAYSTVLDAGTGSGPAPLDVVQIVASGAVLGRARQGFTIINGGSAGVAVVGGAPGARTQGVRVEGNVITRNGGAGVRLDADASSVVGNVIVANMGDALTIDGAQDAVIRNVAIGNGQGVSTRAEHTTFQDNALVANAGPGFFVEAASANSYIRNLVVANSYGFFMRPVVSLGEIPTIRYNDVLGNLGNGITTGMSVTATANNIVGNAVAILAGIAEGDQCGLFADETEPVTATLNYWGDARGPGAPDADHNCSPTNAVVVPFARGAYRFNEGPRALMP